MVSLLSAADFLPAWYALLARCCQIDQRRLEVNGLSLSPSEVDALLLIRAVELTQWEHPGEDFFQMLEGCGLGPSVAKMAALRERLGGTLEVRLGVGVGEEVGEKVRFLAGSLG